MHMITFLHASKKFLNEKYAHIDFDVYLSRRTQNVYLELNCSLLTFCEYDQIISDTEELWLMKKQDTKFKFILPQLIHNTKWKFDCIIFRKNTEKGSN